MLRNFWSIYKNGWKKWTQSKGLKALRRPLSPGSSIFVTCKTGEVKTGNETQSFCNENKSLHGFNDDGKGCISGTVVAVAGGLAIILLRQASEISKALSIRGIEFMSGQRAEYWRGREDSNMRVLRTLANIMGDYEQVPAAERRDRYDDMMRSVTVAETSMFQRHIDGIVTYYRGRRPCPLLQQNAGKNQKPDASH